MKGGLDVTELEKKQLHDRRKFAAISVCSLVMFFGIWYLATAVLHLMPDYSLPSPVQVLEAFIYKLNHKAPDSGTLFQHILASLKVALSGYVLGAGGLESRWVSAWHGSSGLIYSLRLCLTWCARCPPLPGFH